MTSTPGESEALDRLVEPWAAKIAKSSGSTVEAIVTNAENVRAALQELEPYGRKARQLLALRSGLSRPAMSKLETIGRHAQLLRHFAGTLPPSVSSLYALARKPWPELERAVMMDLRAKSCAEIKALFAPPSLPKPTRKLMTILVPPDLNDAARCVLIADIGAALARITENRRVDLDVSLPASGPKIAQVLEVHCQEEQPAEEPGSDNADEKLMDLEEPAAHDIGSEQQSRPEEQAPERRRVIDAAGRTGNMRHHEPDEADVNSQRNDGRAGAGAYDEGFAAQPVGIDPRIMGWRAPHSPQTSDAMPSARYRRDMNRQRNQ